MVKKVSIQNGLKKLFLLAGLLAAMLLIMPVWAGAGDANKKEWQFQIEPYLLFANIKGDASVNVVNDADVDISTSDIFDNLKMGGMIRLEAVYKNDYGLAFDFGFMDLEVDNVPGLLTTWASGVKQTTIELVGFKRMTMQNGYWDIFAGVRRWKNKIEVIRNAGNILPRLSRQRDENWVDAIIGARAYFDIAEEWQLMVRGDIGGLGLESDFTSKVAAGVMYQITESIILDLQYVALWVDYETGTRNTQSYFAYDTVTHGPVLGLIYKF